MTALQTTQIKVNLVNLIKNMNKICGGQQKIQLDVRKNRKIVYLTARFLPKFSYKPDIV